jgi:uncharacterized protein
MTSSNYEKSNRILLVDSLRGFALLGLFFVHMLEYFELYWFNPENSIYHDIIFFLFAGKAYALFALLFGFSFFIIIDNQLKRGIDFRPKFIWRLTLLLIFGFLHGLLYGGDILVVLAAAGFILIPFFNVPNKILLTLSLFFLFQIPSIIYLNLFVDSSSLQNPWHWELFGNILPVYAEGSFFELIQTTLWNSQIAKWAFMFESGRLFTILGMSFLGLFLGKIQFFKNPNKFSKIINIFLPLSFLSAALMMIFKEALTLDFNWIQNSIYNSISDLLITFTQFLIFIKLYNLSIGTKFLNYLAPCGKMSLTIYLLQSLIFVPFFYGFGLGAYQFIGQANSFYLGIIFWIIQMYFANIWFKKFHFGPIEWIWRSLTYFTFNIKFIKEQKEINTDTAKAAI